MNKVPAWDRGTRPLRQRQVLRKFLILCEDTKSSVLYLKKFPIARQIVQVECIGTGKNTDSLMETAIVYKQRAGAAHAPYQAIWVVFDRDSFPEEDFNRCFDLIRNHQDITACWSNECFELWYLLHFEFRQTPILRNEIESQLTRLLGYKYDKADGGIYEALLGKRETALRNARCLAYHNAELGSRRANPSTKVHQLIEMLLKLAPEVIDLPNHNES